MYFSKECFIPLRGKEIIKRSNRKERNQKISFI